MFVFLRLAWLTQEDIFPCSTQLLTNFICTSSEKWIKCGLFTKWGFIQLLGKNDIFNEYQIMFIHKHQFYIQYNKVNSVITKIVLLFNFFTILFPIWKNRGYKS